MTLTWSAHQVSTLCLLMLCPEPQHTVKRTVRAPQRPMWISLWPWSLNHYPYLTYNPSRSQLKQRQTHTHRESLRIWMRVALQMNINSAMTSEQSWVLSTDFCLEGTVLSFLSHWDQRCWKDCTRDTSAGKMQEGSKNSCLLARNKRRHQQNGLKLWDPSEASGKTAKRVYGNNRLTRQALAESWDWSVPPGKNDLLVIDYLSNIQRWHYFPACLLPLLSDSLSQYLQDMRSLRLSLVTTDPATAAESSRTLLRSIAFDMWPQSPCMSSQMVKQRESFTLLFTWKITRHKLRAISSSTELPSLTTVTWQVSCWASEGT